ncbi:hypothetical protein AP75_13550 [Kaistella haifensis DSM 19056]|uniref:Uncharacterized protein n=2 Tax=Kaistella haifensis TaxID=421525 RepID=A0A246B6I7_9FLAO|nr:hypothetical protein AP75_13550 [Kaistella haifensis DSM 19056]
MSCSVSKELRKERKDWDFKNWEQEYKDRAFCLCISNGYENKELEKLLIRYDRSLYNPLGRAIFDKSLVPIIKNEIVKIRIDSINSIGKYPDDLKTIYNKREVLSHCINFYKSEMLDSLAKSQKKNWIKINNILGEIHKEVPTY